MDYRELVLPESSPVARIWIARGDAGPRETILPDGRYELIFNFGDRVMQDGAAQPRAMLAAETRRAVSIAPSGRVDFLGVTLRDGCASAILNAPLREVRDCMLDVRDVDRRLDLHDHLANVSDDQRVQLILDAFREATADPLAREAASTIRATGGRVSISRLATRLGVTIRTLGRAFDRAIGITPKTLARITRLGRAAAMLRGGASGADAALDAGYFDQAHMTNEFRSMAGLSPSRWLDLPSGLGVQFLQDSPPPFA
jgi:AraC-like DNA-binding protein